MNIQSIKPVCFSPTGTTKTIVEKIATSFELSPAKLLDITDPEARKHPLQTTDNELLIIGIPVYMGRVPALLGEWLDKLEAYRTPTVCVVVYGNREFDDALLELQNILKEKGCISIAGAAFIGEHSFSSSELPTAAGRPDERDLAYAELFGRKINEKLRSAPSVDQISPSNFPGKYPYGGITELWNVDFIAVSEKCTGCGICAAECPVGAIDSEKSNLIDQVKCITCCACIKNCPQNARTMKTGPVNDAAMRLNRLCKERKEPELFV